MSAPFLVYLLSCSIGQPERTVSLGFASYMTEGKEKKNWQNECNGACYPSCWDVTYITSSHIPLAKMGCKAKIQIREAGIKNSAYRPQRRSHGNEWGCITFLKEDCWKQKATYHRRILYFPTVAGGMSHLLSVVPLHAAFSFLELVDSMFVLY